MKYTFKINRNILKDTYSLTPETSFGKSVLEIERESVSG